MIPVVTERHLHCNAAHERLKWAILLLAAAAVPTYGQESPPAGAALRQELTLLVGSGQTQRAIERAQAALRAAPDDPAVRREYVTLHLALAQDWASQHRYADCLTAVAAVLAVESDNARALQIQRDIYAARERTVQQASDIDKLLRLELFESALADIDEIKSLRPDLAKAVSEPERKAWRGAADDHYLAGNFAEAFALYEKRLALGDDVDPQVLERWALSLALGLSETGSDVDLHGDGLAGLRERVSAIVTRLDAPLLTSAISGLLAELGGQSVGAGRAYADALGVPWQLPPADQRQATVAKLRQQAIARAQSIYEASATRRREGAWAIVLPDVWKQRRTEHFDVYARNDLVADRVGEAAEFHFASLSAWLGRPADSPWEPRCEIRIFETTEALQRDTKGGGATRALTRTRVQGDRVLSRTISLCQDDPWLLSSTLPHELTHLLLADLCRTGKLPPALDEGLASQAEPPARRLMLRRLLSDSIPEPLELLRTSRIPADKPEVCGQCAALTDFLLHQASTMAAGDSDQSPIAFVLRTFQEGCRPDWPEMLGWESESAMRADWSAWYEARRHPPRMPLMILAPASPRRYGGGD
jgi:tetratricopeptide (TPR) repeat protein